MTGLKERVEELMQTIGLIHEMGEEIYTNVDEVTTSLIILEQIMVTDAYPELKALKNNVTAKLLSIREDLISKEEEEMNKTGNISDGHHTFDELYEHRHALYSALVSCNPNISWKSKLHDDNTMDDGFFIVGMDLPSGTITYHIPISLWGRFYCKEVKQAPKWDGHTSNDVIDRLIRFTSSLQAINPYKKRKTTGDQDFKDLNYKSEGIHFY